MSNRPGRKIARQQSHQGRSRPRDARSRSSVPWWMVGVLAGLVLAALVVAVIVGESGRGSGTDVAQVGFAETIGEPLPLFAATEDDPAIGMAAPTIVASRFDGTEIGLDVGRGRGAVLVFFAHWCSHCQRELPRLTDWLEHNTVPDGVDVVGVSTAVDSSAPNYPPSEWFEDVGWPEVVVKDSSESVIANSFGLQGFPFFVVVDSQGSVLARVSGELTTGRWESLLDLAAG